MARLSNQPEDNDPSPWSLFDAVALVGAFAIRWQLGVAFLVLKIWHQVSGSRLSTFAFIADRWAALVAIVRGITPGKGASFDPVSKPSTALQLRSQTGNLAFDEWQREEVERLRRDAEKLAAERQDFEHFKTQTQRGKDQIEFDAYLHDRDRRLARPE